MLLSRDYLVPEKKGRSKQVNRVIKREKKRRREGRVDERGRKRGKTVANNLQMT